MNGHISCFCFFDVLMKHKILVPLSLLITFFCFWLTGGIAFGATEGGCVSSQCHSGMTNEENTHPAEMDCKQCHKSIVPSHPQQGKKTFRTTTANSCSTCHVDTTAQEIVHQPVADGDCTACHDPHGKLEGKLLPEKEMTLCTNCHDTLISDEITLLHGPIQEGKCSACHNPHGSRYEKLLIGDYSTKIFINYSKEKYKLCFSCHDRTLLRFPDTSYSTEFRDGERNLHYLHVNKPSRGRNCKTCHAIHGSKLPKLIAKTTAFGKWDLPVNFKKTSTGGSCSPGCHEMANYDRKRPINAEEIIQPNDLELIPTLPEQ